MNDEFQADSAPRDLLGDPVDMHKDSWGRPSFEKTEEKQELVVSLKAAGWTNERIAKQMHCDVKTLRKHFSQELSEAVDMLEAEAIMSITKRMRDGNVSAARHILTLSEKGRAAPPERKVKEVDPVADDGQADPKLGKKERLKEAAKKPTGSWAQLLN